MLTSWQPGNRERERQRERERETGHDPVASQWPEPLAGDKVFNTWTFKGPLYIQTVTKSRKIIQYLFGSLWHIPNILSLHFWRWLLHFFFFFSVLGIVLGAQYLLGSCSTTWITLQCFSIFQFFRECLKLLHGRASDFNPPNSTSRVTGITVMNHNVWLICVLFVSYVLPVACFLFMLSQCMLSFLMSILWSNQNIANLFSIYS
jgi:hypothetical protein